MTYDEVQKEILAMISRILQGRNWDELSCDELYHIYKDIQNRFSGIQWSTMPDDYQKAQADLVVDTLNDILDKMRKKNCNMKDYIK